MREIPRSYKTLSLNKCTYRHDLSKLLMTDHPIFTIKLETTGLDPRADQVIKIGVVKCHFEDYHLVRDDVFESLIKVNREIPEHCFRLLGLTQTDFNEARVAEDVMKDLLKFFGSDTINVVGFYTKDFIEPFLDVLGFYSGQMLKIDNILDVFQLATSVLEPNTELPNFKFRTICEYLDLNTETPTEAVFDMFNILYNMVPTGQTKVTIRKSSLWKKGVKKYIILETDCGSLGLNCFTGYFKEKTPGVFDMIDMDTLTQYICETQNCCNINEFIKKYLDLVH